MHEIITKVGLDETTQNWLQVQPLYNMFFCNFEEITKKSIWPNLKVDKRILNLLR